LKQTFYSNGKLLLTGEYVVLDGAKALALPTKFGQYLHVTSGENNLISWKSHDKDGTVWFEDTLTFDDIKVRRNFGTENSVKNTLIEILHQAYTQNSNFLETSKGYTVTTELTFPRFWGLGTSSTLINNIAQWLEIDAFELLRNSFGGSGYDIACAQNDFPIIYHLKDNRPIIEVNDFKPVFTDKLYFVYLNQKQSSKAAIASYKSKKSNIGKTIEKINDITAAILKSGNVTDFSELLKDHEMIMSDVLEIQTVQESLFPDFKGTVKSLGAWGGDFVLLVSEENPKPYFEAKGYPIVIPYSDMIK
jgi:mevalonate kinase